MKQEVKNIKNFSFQLRGIQLNFSLDSDTKEDMMTFLELMESAKVAVETELKKLP